MSEDSQSQLSNSTDITLLTDAPSLGRMAVLQGGSHGVGIGTASPRRCELPSPETDAGFRPPPQPATLPVNYFERNVFTTAGSQESGTFPLKNSPREASP